MKECKHFSILYPYCLACEIETLEQKLRIAEDTLKVYADKNKWCEHESNTSVLFDDCFDGYLPAAEAIRKIGEVGK